MKLVPVTLKQARQFVDLYHRHNESPQGWKFGVGLSDDGVLIGVAIAGRPVARMLDSGSVVEVTRVCTLGQRNANSMLYGAISRAAAALGYERAYTYTLQEETGASLRACGWIIDAEVPAQLTWSRESRPRTQERRPIGPKFRWVKYL